jgi:hypothetical protein
MLNESGLTYLTSKEYAELRTSKGELIVRTTDKVHGVWSLTSGSAPWIGHGDDESYFCSIDGFPHCQLHRFTPNVPYNLYTAPRYPTVFGIAELMHPIPDDLCSYHSSEVDVSEGGSSEVISPGSRAVHAAAEWRL